MEYLVTITKRSGKSVFTGEIQQIMKHFKDTCPLTMKEKVFLMDSILTYTDSYETDNSAQYTYDVRTAKECFITISSV